MIEVRTFDGDAREAAVFTSTVWKQSYGGHHPIPLWDESYYEWQLFGPAHAERSLAVAAYEGGKLVGTFFAEQFPIRLAEHDYAASMSSWLTVDPSMAGKGVGRKLADELRRRHVERGLAFSLGFAVRGTAGPAFWKAMPDTIIFGQIGFWARVLDREAVAMWLLNRSERAALAAFGPFLAAPPGDVEEDGIRPYAAGDLSRCLELLGPLTQGAEVGSIWSAERLQLQLDHHGTPRTLVLERDGVVRGFINYFAMDFLLRTTIRIAQVDLLVTDNLTDDEERVLVRAALRSMKAEGVQLVLVPRLAGCPTAALIRNRFLPLPADMVVTCVLPRHDVPRRRFDRFHLLIR